MDMAWRFRIMIFVVVALMIFGDFFGYGGMMRVVKSDPSQQTAAGAAKFQQKNAEIEISEGEFRHKNTQILEIIICIFRQKIYFPMTYIDKQNHDHFCCVFIR